MYRKWLERLGIKRPSSMESRRLDSINLRVMLVAALFVLCFSIFIFVNLTTVPDAMMDIPNSPSSNPWMGEGSIVPFVALVLGTNFMDNSDEIIRYMTFALSAYNLVVAISSVACIFLKKHSHIFAVILTYSVPVFYMALSLVLFFMNGANNVLLFLGVATLVVTLLAINPVFELVLLTGEFIGIYAIGKSYGALTGHILISVAILQLLTLVLCICVYASRLHSIQNEIRIENLSTHDVLTGLKNRRALTDDEHRFIGRSIVVAMMDIDDFKYFNDSFGHEFGDSVLKIFSSTLEKHFEPEGIYRHGGDEFVIISELSEEEFHDNMDDFRRHIRQIGAGERQQLFLTCSCGFVVGTVDSPEMFRSAFVLADQKLYEAKRMGKDCVLGTHYTKESALDALKDDWDLIYKTNDLDILTGLPNKLHFFNRAAKTIESSDDPTQMAVVYINIENFHVFNLQNGFNEGDVLLKDLSDRIKELFDSDLTSRLESDRFAVLTNRANLVDKLIELHSFGRDYEKMPQEIKAGVALVTGTDVEIAAYCDRAMLACESIKDKHDKSYRFYDRSLEQNMYVQQYFYENLDDAIANEGLVVFYQPIMRTITKRMCAAEALVRWKDDQLGYIAPLEFISVLEKSHLIHKVDAYVIEHVCADIADMRDRGLPRVPISVNLSRMDFWLCDVSDIIEKNVNKYNVPKNLICFELSESSLNEEPQELRIQVQNLLNSGYQVWIDNFGRGYSSLNLLKDYNFSGIKFSQDFLGEFAINKKSGKMVEIMIQMAKDLGVKSLVEGVETKEQYEFLLKIGCEKVQGFYLANPLDYEEFIDGMGELFLVEDVNLRDYYDNISSISTQGKLIGLKEAEHRSQALFGLYISLWEVVGDTLKIYTANDAFIHRLKQAGYDNLQDMEAAYNKPDNKHGTWLREKFAETREKTTVKIVGVDVKEYSYVMVFQCVAKREGRYAVCIVSYEEDKRSDS